MYILHILLSDSPKLHLTELQQRYVIYFLSLKIFWRQLIYCYLWFNLFLIRLHDHSSSKKILKLDNQFFEFLQTQELKLILISLNIFLFIQVCQKEFCELLQYIFFLLIHFVYMNFEIFLFHFFLFIKLYALDLAILKMLLLIQIGLDYFIIVWYIFLHYFF